ncbi:hypothetical protein CHUAL_002582 [Chamberlinius hualienensis]
MASFKQSGWYSKRNLSELYRQIELGDLIEISRLGCRHWAVCVEAGRTQCTIMHRISSSWLAFSSSKSCSSTNSGNSIIEEKLDTVVNGVFDGTLEIFEARINNSLDKTYKPFPPEVIATRAKAHPQDDYNLFTNNCEHFANECRYGQKVSFQIENIRFNMQQFK